jgi:hypothetical protein
MTHLPSRREESPAQAAAQEQREESERKRHRKIATGILGPEDHQEDRDHADGCQSGGEHPAVFLDAGTDNPGRASAVRRQQAQPDRTDEERQHRVVGEHRVVRRGLGRRSCLDRHFRPSEPDELSSGQSERHHSHIGHDEEDLVSTLPRRNGSAPNRGKAGFGGYKYLFCHRHGSHYLLFAGGYR